MTICEYKNRNIHITLNIYIDDHRREILCYVTFAEIGTKYKNYDFKTLKAAWNKYETLVNKYSK